MIKAESVVGVYISNSIENKQAKKLALLSILKADYKHESV